MSKFVLTAQLQLQAPRNASQVLNQIRSQLSGVQVPISVKGAAQATKQVNNLAAASQKANSAAQSMGKSFGLAIKRFAAFTVASRAVSLVTNTLAGAVDEAIDFQREMVKISQVTGKTVKQLKGLQQTITNLSVTLGTSSKDLLAVTRILSQAGIRANELEVALASLAKTTLAPTFEDIEKTAEGAVAIISQFGQGVGALERQLGAINAVAGQFAVESGDLIGAVRRFGGVFKSAGGSLEELLALFTSVRATTRESSESISTGLRTIFTRIQRPRTIEFLKKFGVELLDVEGKFVGPFEAAKRLSEALAGLGEGDITFIRIAEELGGFRQIGKVIPLLQQFEVAEKARQAAIEGGDSLTKDAATAQQALAVQITKVKEEFLALVRSISETASFQMFARTALEIASNLIKVADAIKPLIPLITALAAIKFARGFGGFLASAGSAIQGKNQGGRILGFNRGGLVPGQGNRDTVPAMLSPGEFVIRKSSVNKMGASTLAAMNENRFNFGGNVTNAKSVGAVIPDWIGGSPQYGRATVTLDDMLNAVTGYGALNNQSIMTKATKAGIDPKRLRTMAQAAGFKGANFSTISEGIGQDERTEFNNIIISNTKKFLGNAVEQFGKVAGVAISAGDVSFDDNFDIPNDQKGNFFEQIIDAFQGRPLKNEIAEKNRPFDFVGGVKTNKLFEQVQGLRYLDAKAAGGKGNIGDAVFSKKAKNQGALELYTRLVDDIALAKTNLAAAKKPTRRKAAGGGIGGTDTVPALLTPGEFVINKASAQSIGYGNLNRMNRSGVARFAAGGTVGGIQTFAGGGGVLGSTFIAELKTMIAELRAARAGGGGGAASAEVGAIKKQARKGSVKSHPDAGGDVDVQKVMNEFLDVTKKADKELEEMVKALERANEATKKGTDTKLNKGKVETGKAAPTTGPATGPAGGGRAVAALPPPPGGGPPKDPGNKLNVAMNKAANATNKNAQAVNQSVNATKKSAGVTAQNTGLTASNNGAKTVNTTATQNNANAQTKAANAAQKQAAGSMKFMAGIMAAQTVLAYLTPTIDENSSAFAKVTASVMGMVQQLAMVMMSLAMFGVSLDVATLKAGAKGVGSFLSGGKIGGKGGMNMVRNKVRVGAKSLGRGMQKVPGLKGFGKGLTNIAPKLGKFAAGLGPLIAGLAAAVGAVKLFTGIFDYFTGVHTKAAEAIEKGNVARAGELAVDSQIQKDFNNLAMGAAAAGAAIGAAFGPLGALIGAGVGALVGGFIKIAGQFEPVQKAMKFFRNEVLVMFGGDSTKTIAAQAKLQASVNKLKLEEAKNTERASEAMKDVEAGSRTLAEAFASGDLTGNLKNQLGVLTSTIELEASKMADLDKMYQGGVGSAIAGGLIGGLAGGVGGAAAGAAIGSEVGVGGIFKEMGAILGLTTSAEEDRKKSREEVAKAQAEFTKKFKENGELFAKVAKNIIAADPSQSLEEVKANMLAQNETLRRATEGMGSEERSKFLDKIIENQKKAYDKQLKLIEAMNFGMQKFADRLKGTVSLMQSDATLDQSGGTSFDRSAEVLSVALSSAANTISDDELESAVGVLKQSMRDAGASTEEIEKTVKRFKSLNEFNKRLDENSPAFKEFQAKLKESVLSPKGGTTPENIVKEFGEKMTEGMSDEGKKQIMNALEGMDLEGENLQKIMAGDLSPILEAVGGASEEFKKQIVDGIVKQRGAAEKALIASIKSRKTSEDEFVAAQRKAIDTQLEAAKVFEDFGGKALSGEQKLGARIAQFNAGAAFSGTGGLSTGSASDIRRVAGQIGGNFNTLQSQATIGAQQGAGAFDDRAGAEADNRERLKKQNEALLQFTKQRITLLKEELAIVQKKNAAEKSALEKLLSGDIEGFIEGQAAAGAGAALRTGDAGLANLFGAGALGAGFKTLEGQGLSDAEMERAGGLALGGLGIKDDRAAQILAGSTAEEEAIKSQGRELAGVMGELAQQSAQFEKAEISAKEAIINVQQARLDNISAAADQAQAMARGGVVYANRGIFVPRGTDTVPAMLTPGEFVVNRGAVSRGNNLQILRAMNSGGGASSPGAMSGGGRVNYYNLGGIVEGIGSAITNSLPGLEGVFNQFAASVDKLIGTKFNVALDTTNVNVNFNGASFLETLKDDIKTELLNEVSEQIKKAKPNTSGDLDTRTTVLGN